MIYTIDEIKEKMKPVFDKYGVKEAYLFGSYARGEADEQSDMDIAIELYDLHCRRVDILRFYCDLDEIMGKEVQVTDLGFIGKPMFEGDKMHGKRFKEYFEKDKVSIL